MAATRPGSRDRRRQRSVRVTVSVSLLSVATLGVLGSLPTQSALWLSLASVSAILLSWAALRIMWTEVLQSRRENSADRAAAAAAYRELFSVRAAEHAEFTTAMTERLAEAHLSQRELEGLVAYQEGRARRAETKLVAESGRSSRRATGRSPSRRASRCCGPQMPTRSSTSWRGRSRRSRRPSPSRGRNGSSRPDWRLGG